MVISKEQYEKLPEELRGYFDRVGANAHPTVKPLKLMEYLCRLTRTPTGGVVLDPYVGSGTTALACIKTDRKFIVIEIAEDYYQIAKKRIKHLLGKLK